MIDQSVTLLIEAKDESGNIEMLRSAIQSFDIPPPVVEGHAKTYDVAIYDSKLAGESVTHPHLRYCGWRAGHYHKMGRAFLRALLPDGNDVIEKTNVPESALMVVFDAGRTFGGSDEAPSQRVNTLCCKLYYLCVSFHVSFFVLLLKL